MVIAFTGSNGTGKTATINYIKEWTTGWEFYSEPVREIIPLLGYEDPYDFVEEYGIVFHEAMLISHWSFLKYINNKNYNKIIDRSPIDMFTYFYMLKKEGDNKYEQILEKLVRHYIKFIDKFIYFPIGVFELSPDKMQKKEIQQEYDFLLKKLLLKYNIEYYEVKHTTVSGRAKEIVQYINYSERK